ncbi:alpha/beta fold hydrolase [Streptomyces sp. H10-C2]|uniref:alpha/beta fold hydrolase n=1 Tax=unclassified Streptomyces TaxID=2593676 RepID=UPI0024B91374|nr:MULTISPECIES: alpha/beta fold hydrolase [unclassified Streptomyces]MDJ0341874.1 alpha/beta fold hydrolase [Streptomyces sp. PH10-H1]MDJ0370372.1 alpha/beta fold hydrolase [Streptomyces sp. H10-C2]
MVAVRVRRRALTGMVALAAAGVLTAGAAPAPAAGPAGARDAASPHAGRLTGAAPCPGQESFTCATLKVPLDHAGRTPGTLALSVAMTGNTHAPKGDLVFLTGGPGQPGVPFMTKLAGKLAPVLGQYRMVMIDQRGTGAGALQCPELQAEMGSSDLTPPTPKAVTDCAAAIGPDRRFYSTAATVGDLDLLRQALGARRISLDGVSYGTFVAERYALAHPDRVNRLVLDSVVPQQGDDLPDLTTLTATARVLRGACAATGCATDPARDLAQVVRTYRNGPAVLDMLTTYEFVDADYRGIPEALHLAAAGRPQTLQGYIDGTRQGSGATAEQLSQGLHASALCADWRYPWGTSDTPVAGRAAALERARRHLTAGSTWPFDPATATGQGTMLTCLDWPREPVPPAPSRRQKLPRVPVLLLGGDRDLSTPLEWLRQEARMAPLGQVVIVPGAAHSVQSRATSDAGRQAVYAFLLRG